MNEVINYILTSLTATLSQLLILLGPLLLISFIMNLVSASTEKVMYELIGRKWYLILFGWLGTMFHELGHALFILLFGHKITEMKLFSVDASKGTLGYVNHKYNPNNLYHRVGNFFIGIGPIILCSIMLFISSYFILGVNLFTTLSSLELNVESFTSLESVTNFGRGFVSVFLELGDYLFNSNIPLWRFVLFFYVVFSIGSSIKLSGADVKGAASGFVVFTILLFLFNLGTVWIGDFLKQGLLFLNSYLSIVYSLMLTALGLNLILLLIFGLVSNFKKFLSA